LALPLALGALVRLARLGPGGEVALGGGERPEGLGDGLLVADRALGGVLGAGGGAEGRGGGAGVAGAQ
jgi:hypothetical protein